MRIDDARRRIQSRRQNFEFVLADVYNAQYNPAGRQAAATYQFPFGAEVFDVIYAASLFTHLLPDETRNYFRESGRVLKPDGRCLFSVFMLDFYRGRGTTISGMYEFEASLIGFRGVAVRDPDHPDAAIAYSEAAIRDFAKDARLKILRIIPGLWSQTGMWAANEQDLVLLARE